MKFHRILLLAVLLTVTVRTKVGAISVSQAEDTHQVFLPLIIRPPVPPVAWPEAQFGLNVANFTTGGGINQALESGATWVRGPVVRWAEVEVVEGVRDWSVLAALDIELDTAHELGLIPILIVTGTPAWAQVIPDQACGPILADKLPAFASFMAELADRYAQVQFWELYPTPDIDRDTPEPGLGCWGNPDDPYYGGGDYAGMLANAAPAIKAANPNAQVLTGSLVLDCDPDNSPAGRGCHSSRFLEGILQVGGDRYFDAVAFQAADGFAILDYPWGTAYQYAEPNWHSGWLNPGPVVLTKANFIRNVLDTYGVTGKRLVNTRAAILCYACQNFPPFFTDKEGYLVQAYASALAAGVDVNLWSSLFGEQNSGLLNVNYLPQPAYSVYQFAVAMLEDASYLGEVLPEDVGDVEGVQGYKFAREGTTIWVVWYASITAEAVEIQLPTPPGAAFAPYGNALSLSENIVQIGQAPIYLEWMP